MVVGFEAMPGIEVQVRPVDCDRFGHTNAASAQRQNAMRNTQP
jgi:hypothetical protein